MVGETARARGPLPVCTVPACERWPRGGCLGGLAGCWETGWVRPRTSTPASAVGQHAGVVQDQDQAKNTAGHWHSHSGHINTAPRRRWSAKKPAPPPRVILIHSYGHRHHTVTAYAQGSVALGQLEMIANTVRGTPVQLSSARAAYPRNGN
ncbi:hypothetical protein CALCODRAFT_301631 [Calocera cornea HHB12733]|uniref:Uncharacterized protein n=1 Tax=Calocera cornea HHB12733 TaxID=1353952 RepID=A0A165FIB4_9BASI|nr:hypothetical protein CALCODRAFT_301631 [Calocera cornea HHB12733]